MKRTLLAMALLLTSVFGVTGCGSDDDVEVESRTKNFVFTQENHGGVNVSAAIKSTAGNDFGNIRGQIDVSKSGPSMSRDEKLDLMRDHFRNPSYDLRGEPNLDEHGNLIRE